MSLLRKITQISITFLVLSSLIFTGINTGNVKAITPISIEQRQQYDLDKHCATDTTKPPNMKQILTFFSCGHPTFFTNGTTLRNYTMIIEENHTLPISLPEDTQKSIQFPSWTFNASIPGPTLRMTAGDHVLITVVNKGTMIHSMHMHSIHPGNMDGVPIFSGDSGAIPPGKSFTYNFIANPVGIFPYHCHMTPIAEHINRGLYGGLIIDPPADNPRPKAQEIVMFLNGYDLAIKNPEFPRFPTATEANQIMNGNDTVFDTINTEHDNAIYSVNGIANYYMHHPIPVAMHQPLRIYMYNMLDFEENSFHLHGQVFTYYPSATSSKPMMKGDMIVLGQGDRGILETEFNYPGLYMAHAHFEQVAGRGWSSLFSVK